MIALIVLLIKIHHRWFCIVISGWKKSQSLRCKLLNPCHARPPYERTYPLGPGILWVYPPNQKDFVDFWTVSIMSFTDLNRNTVKGKTLISSIIQYPLIVLSRYYFAKCKGTHRLDISGPGHTGTCVALDISGVSKTRLYSCSTVCSLMTIIYIEGIYNDTRIYKAMLYIVY